MPLPAASCCAVIVQPSFEEATVVVQPKRDGIEASKKERQGDSVVEFLSPQLKHSRIH
jgi:hypothetical protein